MQFFILHIHTNAESRINPAVCGLIQPAEAIITTNDNENYGASWVSKVICVIASVEIARPTAEWVAMIRSCVCAFANRWTFMLSVNSYYQNIQLRLNKWKYSIRSHLVCDSSNRWRVWEKRWNLGFEGTSVDGTWFHLDDEETPGKLRSTKVVAFINQTVAS